MFSSCLAHALLWNKKFQGVAGAEGLLLLFLLLVKVERFFLGTRREY